MIFPAAVLICAAILPSIGENFDDIEESVQDVFRNVLRIVDPENRTRPDVATELKRGTRAIMSYIRMLFEELDQAEASALVKFTATFFRKFSILFERIATSPVSQAEANQTLGEELVEFRDAIATLDDEIREAGQQWADYLESMFFAILNFFTGPFNESTAQD